MKLWDKGFEPDKIIEKFTVGNDRELDMRLALYDVEGSMAHITMLESIGLLTQEELQTLLSALEEIKETIRNGSFSIEEGVEDVHSQVEFMLTAKLGDLGKKIHSGRSRNDQVLLDLKLFMRDELKKIAQVTGSLCHSLLDLAERHKDVLMPGYTHLQIAMPSSFGLWFGAYAESFSQRPRRAIMTHPLHFLVLCASLSVVNYLYHTCRAIGKFLQHNIDPAISRFRHRHLNSFRIEESAADNVFPIIFNRTDS